MTTGEMAYLGLALTAFFAFVLVVFWLQFDDRRLGRRSPPETAYRTPPSGVVKAGA
jgi:hypothetical protein